MSRRMWAKGGARSVGAHFMRHRSRKGPEEHIVSKHRFIRGEVRDRPRVTNLSQAFGTIPGA